MAAAAAQGARGADLAIAFGVGAAAGFIGGAFGFASASLAARTGYTLMARGTALFAAIDGSVGGFFGTFFGSAISQKVADRSGPVDWRAAAEEGLLGFVFGAAYGSVLPLGASRTTKYLTETAFSRQAQRQIGNERS